MPGGLLFHPYVNYPIKYENYDIGREKTQSPTITVPSDPQTVVNVAKNKEYKNYQLDLGEVGGSYNGTVTANITSLTADSLIQNISLSVLYNHATTEYYGGIKITVEILDPTGTVIWAGIMIARDQSFENKTWDFQNFSAKAGSVIRYSAYRHADIINWNGKISINWVPA